MLGSDSSPAILIVDDDVDTASLLRDALRQRGFDADSALSGEACLLWVGSHRVDVVVTDFQMPGMNGVELIQRLREIDPDLLAIVITGVGGLDAAIAAIRAGAFDFITKPVKLDALSLAISRAVDHLGLKRELRRLRRTKQEAGAEGMVGSSQSIREMLELVRRVADSDATVLIT